MTNHPLPHFDQPQLAHIIESLPDATIHKLPFGVIRLDSDSRITFFSEVEARLSGYGNRTVEGKKFFTEIAPCLADNGFLQRLEAARSAGTIDLEFDFVGDFDDADKELRCRIQSASDGGVWIFNQRL